MSATKVKYRRIQLDCKELEKDVKQNPESIISRQS
ncbi:MAG: IS630 transposase-related protein [Trichodesmium sp. MAG_R02]|nr:IS630 transposase-related protein [Trichodesmium sp. MAG_R02]